MDSFFGIGIFELVMIAVIALLVLGPERLPGAMREVAKYMRQLRNISSEFQSQFSDELKMLDEMNPRRIINDVLDPNAAPSTTSKGSTAKPATAAGPSAGPSAKPPVPAKPLAAKSPATAPPNASAATIGTVAAAPAAAKVITNEEEANTILPPAKPQAAGEPVKSTHEIDPAELPPPGAPPALVDLPSAGQSNGVHPTDAGAEAMQ
jgi:sec-independent protein translocase protein TatB